MSLMFKFGFYFYVTDEFMIIIFECNFCYLEFFLIISHLKLFEQNNKFCSKMLVPSYWNQIMRLVTRFCYSCTSHIAAFGSLHPVNGISNAWALCVGAP
jgi:hypothetical protein